MLGFALESSVFTFVDMALTGKVKVEVMLGGMSNWIQATVTAEAVEVGNKVHMHDMQRVFDMNRVAGLLGRYTCAGLPA